MRTNNVNIAYAEWLNGMPWGYYCTLTTRYPLSMPSARRAAQRLHSYLQKKIGGIRIFWVAEPFDSKYGYHIHALVNIANPILHDVIELIKKAWQVVSKGRGGKKHNNTVIEPYKSELGANFYVSKYMLRQNSDYDIFFPSINAP